MFDLHGRPSDWLASHPTGSADAASLKDAAAHGVARIFRSPAQPESNRPRPSFSSSKESSSDSRDEGPAYAPSLPKRCCRTALHDASRGITRVRTPKVLECGGPPPLCRVDEPSRILEFPTSPPGELGESRRGQPLRIKSAAGT